MVISILCFFVRFQCYPLTCTLTLVVNPFPHHMHTRFFRNQIKMCSGQCMHKVLRCYFSASSLYLI